MWAQKHRHWFCNSLSQSAWKMSRDVLLKWNLWATSSLFLQSEFLSFFFFLEQRKKNHVTVWKFDKQIILVFLCMTKLGWSWKSGKLIHQTQCACEIQYFTTINYSTSKELPHPVPAWTQKPHRVFIYHCVAKRTKRFLKGQPGCWDRVHGS